MHPRLLFLVVMVGLPLSGAVCIEDQNDAGPNLDRPVIGENCGANASVGNAIGIGQYCESTSDCPVAGERSTIQCSTVLTDDALPLLCSRICGSLDGGAVDCGDDAVCHNILYLGYDLDVCVPYACDELFDGGLPRESE